MIDRYINPVTSEELKYRVKNVKTKIYWSVYRNQLSVGVFKTIIEPIAPVSVYLINLSFSQGVFLRFKKCLVRSCYWKKGNSI